jgi:hypothetical protein
MPLNQRLLFLVALLALHALALLAHHLLQPPPIPVPPPPHPGLQHCLVLSLNASREPLALSPSLSCTIFPGERFSPSQFFFASPAARRKLVDTSLQDIASDLSNNNSLSIYLNHVHIWRRIARSNLSTPVLVLEDDAVVTATNLQLLNDILEQMQHRRNFVLKLFSDNLFWWGYKEWNATLHVGAHDVKTCQCRPWLQTWSTAAYVLDAHAARALLARAMPAEKHVDVFLHDQGCIDKTIELSVVDPSIVSLSMRPSEHAHESSFLPRLRLLIRELIENIKRDSCGAIT